MWSIYNITRVKFGEHISVANVSKLFFQERFCIVASILFFNHTFFQSRMLITYLPADLLNQFYTYLAAAATVVIFHFIYSGFSDQGTFRSESTELSFFTLTRLTGSLIFALMASMFILI